MDDSTDDAPCPSDETVWYCGFGCHEHFIGICEVQNMQWCSRNPLKRVGVWSCCQAAFYVCKLGTDCVGGELAIHSAD